jgi:hypothetical protein
MTEQISSETPVELIANCLWHRCSEFLDCKTSDLEAAGKIILEYLAENGYGPPVYVGKEIAQRQLYDLGPWWPIE